MATSKCEDAGKLSPNKRSSYLNFFESLFAVCIAASIVAISCFYLLKKYRQRANISEDQNFLDAMLSIVGTLVSIVIGLLVAFALDHYQSIEQSVDTEAANVSQIYRVTAGLPVEARRSIRALCDDYNKDMIENEWPAMQEGNLSQTAFPIYARMMTSIARFRPSNDGESNVHAALITSCQEVGNGRRMRILALRSNWIGHVMPVLLMCAVIVLFFAILYLRTSTALNVVLFSLVALALGGNLGLVFLLSHPFTGEWRIPPRGFELNRQILKDIKTTPELKFLLQEQN